MSKSLSVNIQNCNGAGNITRILPITTADCNKTVNLTFRCGSAPWTVNAVIQGSTTSIGNAVFNIPTGAFTYAIPSDGVGHNVIITVRDSANKVIATILRNNIKC